jgi:hypothetical protein
MAGGLFNLVSVGNNNIILTGSPTKTFFKVVYSKYTNFGLQKFRIDYDGLRDLRLTTPSQFTFKIPRNADLLMDTYLSIYLPDIWSPIYHPCLETNNKWSPYDFRWIKNLGTQIIKEIVISCGAQVIQKFSGEYLHAMLQRDFNNDKKELIDRMTGNVAEYIDPGNTYTRLNAYPSAFYTSNVAGAEPSIRGRNIYIPINLWFTLDSRCAFPLVCLQYNELSLTVTLRPIQELFQVRNVFDYTNNHPHIQPDFTQQQFQMYRFLQTPPSVNIDYTKYINRVSTWNADIHLISTYAFLSEDERKLFAAEDQMYLVKDVFQYKFENVAGTNKVSLTSNGMVSSWMWYFQRSDIYKRNEWSNYTNWPYKTIPYDITLAPTTQRYDLSFQNSHTSSLHGGTVGVGPGQQLNSAGESAIQNTRICITNDFNPSNQKDILQTMGILFNGDYRENIFQKGIYDYIEKYVRTPGSAEDGIYCYNFCLNTNPFKYQPSGAINMSKFKDIQLEFTTYLPQLNLENSYFQVVCDGDENIIGVTKPNSFLYEYNYDLTVFEERYNILSFISGNASMLYAR